MAIDSDKARLIYETLIDVAKNQGNLLPGGLGNIGVSTPDLKKLAADLCDAFEVVSSRESSSKQLPQ